MNDLELVRGDDLLFSFTATVEQVVTELGRIRWMRCRSLNGRLMHLSADNFNYLDAEFVSDDLWRVSFAGRFIDTIENNGVPVGFTISGKSGRRTDVRYDRLPDLCYLIISDAAWRSA